MIGFVDESIRAGANGIYVIAAAIIAPSDSDHMRQDVRALLRGRQQRFHWRDESEAMRQRMLDHLTRLDLDAIISVQEPVEPAKLERARALCLQRLLWELLDTDLEELVIESPLGSLNATASGRDPSGSKRPPTHSSIEACSG